MRVGCVGTLRHYFLPALGPKLSDVLLGGAGRVAAISRSLPATPHSVTLHQTPPCLHELTSIFRNSPDISCITCILAVFAECVLIIGTLGAFFLLSRHTCAKPCDLRQRLATLCQARASDPFPTITMALLWALIYYCVPHIAAVVVVLTCDPEKAVAEKALGVARFVKHALFCEEHGLVTYWLPCIFISPLVVIVMVLEIYAGTWPRPCSSFLTTSC